MDIQPAASGIENFHAPLLKLSYRLTGDRILTEVAPRAPANAGRQLVIPKDRRSCSLIGLKAPSFLDLLRQPTHPYFHPLWWQLKTDMERSQYRPLPPTIEHKR